jgi:hypothetical protein
LARDGEALLSGPACSSIALLRHVHFVEAGETEKLVLSRSFSVGPLLMDSVVTAAPLPPRTLTAGTPAPSEATAARTHKDSEAQLRSIASFDWKSADCVASREFSLFFCS